jgi:hypothetical protein
MSDGYNFKILSAEIIKRSSAKDWATAKREWSLLSIYEADEDETCLCQHTPIREICVIRNAVTCQVTEVGNVCIKKFFGIRSDLIFVALSRVRRDITKSLNPDAITFFHQRSVVNNWESRFLQDTCKKRSLSAAQMRKRVEINQRVIDIIASRGLMLS